MTLIELLIAFAILMGGLVCIFALLLSGLASHRRAIKESEATQIAASELADLRGEFARGKVPRGDGEKFHDLDDHPGFQVNRVLFAVDAAQGDAVRTVNAREYFVRVKVRWSEKGENQFIEFKTIMFRGSASGPSSSSSDKG